MIAKIEDCAHITTLAPGIKGLIVFKGLYNEYNILFELKHIFSELGTPSYDDQLELDMMVRNARDHKYPLGKEWGEMMVQIKKALATHQERKTSAFEADIKDIDHQM